MIPTEEDGTIPDYGIKYACKTYPTDKSIVQYLDLYSDSIFF